MKSSTWILIGFLIFLFFTVIFGVAFSSVAMKNNGGGTSDSPPVISKISYNSKGSNSQMYMYNVSGSNFVWPFGLAINGVITTTTIKVKNSSSFTFQYSNALIPNVSTVQIIPQNGTGYGNSNVYVYSG